MSFDLPEWLIEIGLPQYLELFLSQGFDGSGLASLTDADLRELGIAAMGHRKSILREAASLALPRALVLEYHRGVINFGQAPNAGSDEHTRPLFLVL